MTGSFDNPLLLPDDYPSSSAKFEDETGNLPDITRGRMFCLMHGRECYRQFSATGEGQWICPDERHLKPVKI